MENIESKKEKEFSELPLEIQEFLLGEDFSLVIVEMNKLFDDTSQIDTFEMIARLFLIDQDTNQEIFKNFLDKMCKGDIEKRNKIGVIFEEKIVAPMAMLLEIHQELADEAKTAAIANTPIKTTPSDVSLPDIAPFEIAAPASTPAFSLASKMAMPGVVAPIASVGQKFVPGPQAPTAPSAPRPAADPYREMPL